MAILTILYKENVIKRVEIDSIPKAKEYVNSDKVTSEQSAIYSTFNNAGVENTIKIIKR